LFVTVIEIGLTVLAGTSQGYTLGSW